MDLDIVGGIKNIFSSSRPTKRKLKYQVKVKGVRISKHSTLTLARKAAKGKMGATVTPLAKRPKNFRKRNGRKY